MGNARLLAAAADLNAIDYLLTGTIYNNMGEDVQGEILRHLQGAERFLFRRLPALRAAVLHGDVTEALGELRLAAEGLSPDYETLELAE